MHPLIKDMRRTASCLKYLGEEGFLTPQRLRQICADLDGYADAVERLMDRLPIADRLHAEMEELRASASLRARLRGPTLVYTGPSAGDGVAP